MPVPSFLLSPGAKIRAGGYHYLSEQSSDQKKKPHKPPPLNGPIHVEFTTTKNVLANALEEELGALSVNCQRGAAPRISLEEMGHHQPPAPVVIDYATSDGFVNDNIIESK